MSSLLAAVWCCFVPPTRPQGQAEVRLRVEQGLAEVQKVGQLSLELHHSMSETMNLTVGSLMNQSLKW